MKSAHEEYISFWPASGSTVSLVSFSQTHRSSSTNHHRQGLHRQCLVLNKSPHISKDSKSSLSIGLPY